MAASSGMGAGGAAAGAAGGAIAAIGGGIAPQTQKANIAAQSLFGASAAANAIPVAGQFVSAGLAIAGLFVKIFAGKKKKKREERRIAKEKEIARSSDAIKAGTQSGGSGGVGIGSGQSPQGATAPVSGPAVPSFSSWGGGSAPPVQQALNNKTGI